jgi:hypothetical protein
MLVAYRLAGLSALGPYYAGVNPRCAMGQDAAARRPSVTAPSVENIGGDKGHDRSDHDGDDNRLGRSRHDAHVIARFGVNNY